MFNTARFFTIPFTALSLAALLTACDPAGMDTTEATPANTDGINWYAGSLTQAFEEAKQNNSPLFLYWGAVWCPPCEEIKQTVFKSPNFIAQSRLFIPVYLDGDTERAQTWGEHFSVQGYPTMIVFNPAGEEITRLPGAIDIERYNEVLKLSLNGMQNTADLVRQALTDPDQPSADDYTQLAFYSWSQSNLDLDTPVTGDLLETLADGARAKGNDLAASRLLFESLINRYDKDETLPAGKAATTARQLADILAQQPLVIANMDFSLFWSQEIVELVTEPGKQREKLSGQWIAAMADLHYSPELSKAEQLGSWYPPIYLYWLNRPDAESMPEETLNEIRAHIDTLDENTRGPARQTVINKAYQVLQAAHLYEESREMLMAETQKSENPYYFMSSLASLEEKMRNNPEAVDWLEQAYDNATGQATRFQWGVEYVTGTIRLQPQDRERITTATNSLLDNLAEPGDVFSGRNYGRLQTLLTSLSEWNDTTGQEALTPFYQSLQKSCEKTVPNSRARENCQALAL